MADRADGPARRTRLGPAAALVLLSPFMAEVLSGATPVLLLVLFPPFIVLDLCLYGCGALVIREVVVRWGRGWPSILALGVAYAIVEEGLVVATFFDPLSPPRKDFGSWGAGPDGSNWVWISILCVYHAVVSIALPIVLAQLIGRSRAHQPWLSNRRLILAGALFLLGAALGRAMFSSGAFGEGYHARIAAWQLVASLAAIAGLVVLARVLPARLGPAFARGAPPSPRVIAAVSAAAYLVYFVSGWGGKEMGLTPAVALAISLGVVCVAAAGLALVSARAGWSERHRLAVAAGVIAFYVALSPLLDLVGVAVGVVTGYALWRAWRSLARLDRADG